MGRKGTELTQEDIANLRIQRSVLDFIELQVRTSTRSQQDRLRILDWGSGRGSLVIKLRDLGYEAFGVELDEAVMRRGFNQVVKRGERPEDIFFTPDKLKKVADGYFDLILSHQVLEHVSDLDSVAKEMARLTAKGGRGFHRFPGSRKIMEPHVYIPFVHWLPKNSIRAKAIRFGLACGFGPKKIGREWSWKGTRDLPPQKQTQRYAAYLDAKTFYRSVDTIRDKFERMGFSVSCSTLKPPSLG